MYLDQVLGVLIDELLDTGIELFFNEPLIVFVLSGSELVVPVEHPVVNTGNGRIDVGFNRVLDPPKRELPVQVPYIQARVFSDSERRVAYPKQF